MVQRTGVRRRPMLGVVRVLVTLAIAYLGTKGRWFSLVAVPLVAISILVNAWGVYWGVTLGW